MMEMIEKTMKRTLKTDIVMLPAVSQVVKCRFVVCVGFAKV